MDAIEAILSRRSIRKYEPLPVPGDIVVRLLRCAMAAPSAGNEQPWHFVVITDRKILDEIPKFHSHSQMLTEAPAAIAICSDEELEKYKGFGVQDCAAATQNILLAAHALGLGGVWLGMHPSEDAHTRAMRKLLNLPAHVTPFALVALGYPAEDKPAADRYEATRVHMNRW